MLGEGLLAHAAALAALGQLGQGLLGLGLALADGRRRGAFCSDNPHPGDDRQLLHVHRRRLDVDDPRFQLLLFRGSRALGRAVFNNFIFGRLLKNNLLQVRKDFRSSVPSFLSFPVLLHVH